MALATARLLERIFGESIDKLLAAPTPPEVDEAATQLRQRVRASRRVDDGLVGLLTRQLDRIRQIDRQFGAVVTYDEIAAKAAQLTRLLTYSLTPSIRTRLAALLSEVYSLAGWAALDLGRVNRSWRHHENAKAAAREAGSASLLAHATAQQAVILMDIKEASAAVEQIVAARSMAHRAGPPVLCAWLAAAHGEGLALKGHGDGALRAFDEAEALLPSDPVDPVAPFIFLGGAHLGRWRGRALTMLGHCDAGDVLLRALNCLDPTFTRAEIALRADLASTLKMQGGHHEAQLHLDHAFRMAIEIGSVRNRVRCKAI